MSKSGGIVFVRFDGVLGTVAIEGKQLVKLKSVAGGDNVAQAAVLLLHEMIELFDDRPYQALGKNGPHVCLFCGETTMRVQQPKHMEDCPWPRVLSLFRRAQ